MPPDGPGAEGAPSQTGTVETPVLQAGAGTAPPGGDPTQLIVNDPLVKRAVELFNARIVHVEPWSRQ